MTLNNWQTKKLGEIIKLEYGKPLHKTSRIADGKYPVYGANGIKNYSDSFYFNKPSIIVGRKGSAGEINLTERKFWPLDVTYFVTFDDKKYDLKFLYNLLITLELTKLAKGVKPGINRIDVYSIEVSIPSLLEQCRIVKTLDEVFEKIEKAKENTEKNLQNSKELFESYLQKIFADSEKDWEVKRLGDVLQNTETVNPLNSPNKEFIYIDVSSVNKENLSVENTTLIKGKDAPSRARKHIKTGDVIFATVRPTLRRIAVISEEFDGQICSTGYFVLRAKEYLDNKLIYYFLQTKIFNEKMQKLQKGASYPAVTDGDVRNQIISFPKSLSEQKTIVEKLDVLSEQTKKLEAIYKQKLSDLEELKKSVLRKAFNGEL